CFSPPEEVLVLIVCKLERFQYRYKFLRFPVISIARLFSEKSIFHLQFEELTKYKPNLDLLKT
ncbi:MAG: hypothetical protein EBY35_06290, partial [Rhodobacteraceae bacterium]|nr:hypothetical protein [Paracoccaceae bacterium]